MPFTQRPRGGFAPTRRPVRGGNRRLAVRGPRSRRSGKLARQSSCAYRQRGANGQLAGSVSMFGGAPSIGCSAWRRPVSRRGTLWSRPSVYGCRGEAKIGDGRSGLDDRPRVHDLNSLAHPGYDSEVVRDQDRVPVPRSVTRSRRRSRICAWIVTSRAVVGSSAMRILGSHASAIAIIARCRMPPENWCG